MAPALRALLAGAAGHLLGHGSPAVAVLRLGGNGDGDIGETDTKRLLHREKVERRTDEASASVGRGGAYLEAGEDDVLGVGPWRALEVNGVGHEGCWGVESLRFTRVSAGSSKLAFSRAECDKCQFFLSWTFFLDCFVVHAANLASLLAKNGVDIGGRIRALAKKIKTPHLTT